MDREQFALATPRFCMLSIAAMVARQPASAAPAQAAM
jgi:hypothetical protein